MQKQRSHDIRFSSRISALFQRGLKATAVMGVLCMTLSSAYAKDFPTVGHISAMQTDTLTHETQKSLFVPGKTAGILLPYKADALDGRQPLVLVHGIGGTTGSKLSEWDDFLIYSDKIPAFQKQFKVYLYHYDSAQSVPTVSRLLQSQLQTLLSTLPDGQKIKLVGYSEGGLLVRNAMQNDAINPHVEQVITIATPFHGSPMASKAWFTSQVNREKLLAPIRVSRKFAYWLAEKKYPNFQSDFCWDNVDEAMATSFAKPEFTELLDKRPKDYALSHKTNFITYGSFFGTADEAEKELSNSLALTKPIPDETSRIHLGKSMIFSFANKTIGKIGKIVTRTASSNASKPVKQVADISESHILLAVANMDIQSSAEPIEKNVTDVPSNLLATSMMPFNDGISPISSSLWLGRFTSNFQKQEKDPQKRLWAALRSLKGKETARLFPAMDHYNWVEGSNRTNTASVPDLLNPQDPPKSAFGWLVSDLMQKQ